jgi:hypothetical protein
MSQITHNINEHLKNLNYTINLTNLIELIIKEFITEISSIKITKNSVCLLDTIVQVQKQGEFILSDLLNDKYSYIKDLPRHHLIEKCNDPYILNNLYLKLVNILVNEKIIFNYNKIYIENRSKLVKNSNDGNTNLIMNNLQSACQYMENLVLNHIKSKCGFFSELVPNGKTINSKISVGEFVVFLFLQ